MTISNSIVKKKKVVQLERDLHKIKKQKQKKTLNLINNCTIVFILSSKENFLWKFLKIFPENKF